LLRTNGERRQRGAPEQGEKIAAPFVERHADLSFTDSSDGTVVKRLLRAMVLRKDFAGRPIVPDGSIRDRVEPAATPVMVMVRYAAESRSEIHSIGAAVETALTLTLQSEYPTATQQE
jgi:hypothetical protein